MASARKEWNGSRRNWFQVRRADAVYVVAYRSNPSPETPRLDIGGGTGWACQWYIDRFLPGGEDPKKCKLYFYDDGAPAWPGCLKDLDTHRKWNQWNIELNKWEPVPGGSPPPPQGFYAGIGGTILDKDYGEKAIRDLYQQPIG